MASSDDSVSTWTKFSLPEDGSKMFLRNLRTSLLHYTVLDHHFSNPHVENLKIYIQLAMDHIFKNSYRIAPTKPLFKLPHHWTSMMSHLTTTAFFNNYFNIIFLPKYKFLKIRSYNSDTRNVLSVTVFRNSKNERKWPCLGHTQYNRHAVK